MILHCLELLCAVCNFFCTIFSTHQLCINICILFRGSLLHLQHKIVHVCRTICLSCTNNLLLILLLNVSVSLLNLAMVLWIPMPVQFVQFLVNMVLRKSLQFAIVSSYKFLCFVHSLGEFLCFSIHYCALIVHLLCKSRETAQI